MIDLPPSAFPNEIDAGMTLRDYFAAKAMQALVSEEHTVSAHTIEMLCMDAYFIADAMMKERWARWEKKE